MNKECKYCGKLFHIKPSHYDIKFYCSKKCMAEQYKIEMVGSNNPNYSNSGLHICRHCGKSFKSYNKSRKYCSLQCYVLSDTAKERAKLASEKYKHPDKYCKRCGAKTKQTNVYCEACNPNRPNKTPKICELCGVEFYWPHKKRYCPECHASGEWKVKVFSICDSCGSRIENIRYRKYCDVCLKEFFMQSRITPRRVDANQPEIIRALIAVGCKVLDLTAVGGGCPDLCVSYNNIMYLLEVKVPGGRLNKRQMKFFEEWQGTCFVVHSIEEALKTIKAIE